MVEFVDTSVQVVKTTSNPKAFPSSLRQKLSVVQDVTADDIATEAEVSPLFPSLF